MPAYWLFKTEPEVFSWDMLKARGKKGEAWDGVRNFQARNNMRAMKKGDRGFFYHTGDEKQVVGIVEVIREAYRDATDETGKFVCVDVKALEPLSRPVTLAEIRAEPRLKDMVLVQQPRLSVQPVTDAQWRVVCEMAGLKRQV